MGGRRRAPAPVNQSNPTTTNTDRRSAVSNGAGVTGDNSSAVNIDTQVYEFTSNYDWSDRSTDNSQRSYDFSNRSTDNSFRNYDWSDRSTDIDASQRSYDLSNRSSTSTTDIDASQRSYDLSNRSSTSNSNTSNYDWADSSVRVDNSNSSEAIKYMASQGSDTVQALSDAGVNIIKNSGGAIIELAQFQGEKNTESFDTLVKGGTRLIEKMLDKSSEGFGLAAKVVDSFTPVQNKEADNGKYMWMAAAAAAAVVLFKGK